MKFLTVSSAGYLGALLFLGVALISSHPLEEEAEGVELVEIQREPREARESPEENNNNMELVELVPIMPVQGPPQEEVVVEEGPEVEYVRIPRGLPQYRPQPPQQGYRNEGQPRPYRKKSRPSSPHPPQSHHHLNQGPPSSQSPSQTDFFLAAPSSKEPIAAASGGGGGGGHGDYVDYGAYTGGWGAFGWYSDHPVGGGWGWGRR